MKIKEVIIVEGKSDIARVRQAVDAEIIPTYGFGLSPETLSDIEAAYRRCGIIILTDPDGGGAYSSLFDAALSGGQACVRAERGRDCQR